MIPQLVTVKVRRRTGRTFRVWIPLLPIALVFSPLLVLSVLVGVTACLIYRVHPGRALAGMWRLLCALRGVRLDIEQARTAVLVTIS
jgi:hypothetical protein